MSWIDFPVTEPTRSYQYKCEACRRTFWSTLSRRFLEAQYRGNFPGELKEEPGVMCNECWYSFKLGAML